MIERHDPKPSIRRYDFMSIKKNLIKAMTQYGETLNRFGA
jgi:hypothetical protein